MTKTALLGATALVAAGPMLVRDGEAVPAEQLTRELAFEVRAETIDEEARTVELSFSSEEPYQRWWGTEVLDHKASSIRLGRLNAGGALLMDHNTRDQVGVVERAWIKGRKAYAVVRFGRSARAEEVFQDVKDGIRKLVSVGYRIHELVLEKAKEGQETYRATDWEPYEISLVAVPADPSVGVGRDGEPAGFDPRTLLQPEEEDDMSATRNAGGGAAPANVTPAATPATPVTETREAAPAPAAPASAAPSGPSADEVRREERSRIANIRAMGERLNCRELAETAISDGRSMDDFIAAYNARVGEARQVRTAEDPAIGLSQRDRQSFSFMRLMNAVANPLDRQAVEAAAFELECSRAARQRTGRDGEGETIPVDLLRSDQRRDLVVGTPSDGGNLVATDLLSGSFIDMLRNQMSVMNAGATMLTDLNGNIAIPRQTGGATGYWVAENGEVTGSAPTFDQVAMTPKTVGALVEYSRQFLLQSSIDAEVMVRRDIMLQLAIALDLASLNGAGSGGVPRGVMQTAGIGAVVGGTNGAAPAWQHIVKLETEVAADNALVGTLAYITNTKVRGKLKETEKFAGGGREIWGEGDQPLNGYPAIVSNQVPSNLTKGTGTNLSAIIFGNWADVIIGMWGGLDILLDPYTGSAAGKKRIVAHQSVDVAVRHPQSFAAMVDAITG
jgi:HK97 family phage major capsid protein